MISELQPPPQSFVAASAIALVLIMFLAILTIWVPGHWAFDAVETGVLALAVVWAIRMAVRPYFVRGSPVLIPLAAAVLVGIAQLIAGSTVNRWETWTAVLRWAVYGTAAFLALQIFSSPETRTAFRRALLYFGFVISVIAAIQYFTSAGKVFWLFQTDYQDRVLGPFVSHDHYAAWIELILPIALFEALSYPKRTLQAAAMAGAMFASVIAGASRAGSALLALECVVILLLASWKGLMSGRRVMLGLVSALLICCVAFTAVVGWRHLWDRFHDPDPFRGRREILISTLAMTRARPWTGFGLGNYENIYPGYAVFDTGDIVDHAHNDWAEWAAEGGLPFLVCLLAAGLWIAPRSIQSLWGLGVVAVLLHSAIDFPMQRHALALWFFVMLGAVCARKHRS